MYKKSLADKIVSKKEKAELVREQQARIAQTCRTQRVSYEKAFALVNEEKEAAALKLSNATGKAMHKALITPRN